MQMEWMRVTKLVAGLALCAAAGARCQEANQPRTLGSVIAVTQLNNGIELKCERGILRVTALKDDVLRVQATVQSAIDEDGSWSVREQSRSHAVTVKTSQTDDQVGFTTATLRVKIGRKDAGIVISDREGWTILSDSEQYPLEFHGSSYQIYKTMPRDEHYFGLGDKAGPLDRRGEAFTLQATPAFHFQESTDPLYKSIPFFLGFRQGKAYGILMDSTWRGYADFGKAVRDTYSFGAEGGDVDYYVLYGPAPMAVEEKYAWLTGAIPLPPMWALGYQQSRFTYVPDARVREIADKLRADRIPADAMYLDIQFQNHNRPFTTDPKLFPDLPGLVRYLSDRHLHLVVITDMHIPVLPNTGYAPYDSGIQEDVFVKNPDGTRYVGSVWPGPSMFPDFARQATRAWWGTLYKRFYGMGISGFWNDMNEPSVFDSPYRTIPPEVRHRIEEPGFKEREATHQELHNIYGMENSRATYEGLLKIKPDERPFVLTRSTSAGGQRYAAVWTGDNSSTWNHLRLSTAMLLNLGLSGFSFAGDDIGGFAGSPSPELLTRWMEVGAFNPLYRNHTEAGTENQEPWVHGKEQEDIRRHAIEERYRLLPYLYTMAEESSRDGIPIMRPLFLEFPDAGADKAPLDLAASNEFLFGASLLVAPPPFGEMVDSYPLVLPSGGWYDYWTGKRVHTTSVDPYKSPRIKPSLAELPVYVRPGSIIPRQPLIQSTDETPKGDLDLEVYPGPACKGSLYQDDGKSFAYRRGEYLRLVLNCEQGAGWVRIGISKPEGTWKPWWQAVSITLHGWTAKGATVRAESGAVDGAVSTDPHAETVQFRMILSQQGTNVWVSDHSTEPERSPASSPPPNAK